MCVPNFGSDQLCNVPNFLAPLRMNSKSQVPAASGQGELKENGPHHLVECFFP